MITSIKRFFDTHLAVASPQTSHHPQQTLRLAVAALWIEVTASDGNYRTEERQMMLDAVRRHFGLSAGEAEELLDLAQAEHANATDYFQFTRLINQHYTQEQKILLIETLWQIAYADRELHSVEEHVIRRLAELIHIPHSAFIAAKHRIQSASPIEAG